MEFLLTWVCRTLASISNVQTGGMQSMSMENRLVDAMHNGRKRYSKL